MYSVLIKGFPTKKEAEEFINWYDGQGEQDTSVWFEINNEENGGRSPMVTRKNVKDVGEIIEMSIEMN